MVNVYDKAHELARALKESAEYRSYAAAKDKVEQNDELAKMINDFHEKNMAVQTQRMMTGQLDQEAMAEVESLYRIVTSDPVAAQYIQSEFALTQVVSEIYRILGEVVQFGQ